MLVFNYSRKMLFTINDSIYSEQNLPFAFINTSNYLNSDEKFKVNC